MDTTTPSMNGAAYLRWMLATAALLVAAVAAFNVAIDPLGVFGSPRIAGVDAVKPHLDHYRELTHWKAAQRLCAKTGIFGNSRAEIGLNPASPPLLAHGLAAYDHAVPGTGADLSYRQLKWLDEAGCMPHTVFLGVDFFDFLGGRAAGPMSTLDADPAPRFDARFVEEEVVSVTGLEDSLQTLSIQRARHPDVLTELGFNPLDNYLDEVTQSGAYTLFRQKAQDNIANWRRQPPRIHPASGGPSDSEQAVDAFVAKAQAAHSKVYLIIYPYHAEARLIVERLGLGALFAQWKMEMVALAARHSAPDAEVELWDFSGLSPQTLEAIPPPGDHHTQLRWFWEAGHFKQSLGDLAVERMLGAPNGFGIRLAGANVGEWVARDRAQVQALMATPSPLMTEVDSLLPPGKP
jgi:hypothetical protein